MIWQEIEVLSEEEKVGNIKLVRSNRSPNPFYYLKQLEMVTVLLCK
jgi:hypothetical protein